MPDGLRYKHSSIYLKSKESYSLGIPIADIKYISRTAYSIWPAYLITSIRIQLVRSILLKVLIVIRIAIIFLSTLIEHISLTVLEVLTLEIIAISAALTPDTARTVTTSQYNSSCYKTAANQHSSGCGNTMPSGSYGKTFNANKGGIYATWLTTEAIKVSWFPRNNIPADIKNGKPKPNT
ncbi:hypothetical protein QX201_007908 [Fusarium graminearum]